MRCARNSQKKRALPMSEYNTGTVNVTNGDATVEGIGTAFLSNVAAGDIFTKLASGVIYYVGSVTDDTHLELTGNYAGATESGISYTISTSFTSPDDIPYPEPGDTQPATITGAAIAKIQALFTSILNGTKAFTNPAAVRTQLAARALHKTDARPAAADMNAGDLWADTDYATGLCAVYCIIDPANSALDTLDYFIKTDTGGRLNLENSIATTIDCSAGGTITLSALQNAYGHYNLTGSPSADFNLVVDNRKRKFTVNNATGKAATVKTSGGSGIAVPNGVTQELRSDGTNVVVTDFDPSKVSHYVAGFGGSTANYWQRVATITPNTTVNIDATLHLEISGRVTSSKVILAEILVHIRQESGLALMSDSHLDVLRIANDVFFDHNSFMLTASSTAAGTGVELWTKCKLPSANLQIYELSRSKVDVVSIAYETTTAWQAATPTGAATITSDWAGSGQLTSTSFQNGWAGTAYYERSSDGFLTIFFDITTVGTTTAGTTVFTIPAGFRHGEATAIRIVITAASGTGDVVGVFNISAAGVIAVYQYTAGGGALRSSTAVYRVRN